jgi:hypothetical protein
MNFKLGGIDLAGIGNIYHRRQPMEIDKQTAVRPNRDTLYSTGVGPRCRAGHDHNARSGQTVHVTYSDRRRSLRAGVYYGKGGYTFTRKEIGTRYIMLGVRTLVDLTDPKDPQRRMLYRMLSRSIRKVLASSRYRTGTQ